MDMFTSFLASQWEITHRCWIDIDTTISTLIRRLIDDHFSLIILLRLFLFSVLMYAPHMYLINAICNNVIIKT